MLKDTKIPVSSMHVEAWNGYRRTGLEGRSPKALSRTPDVSDDPSKARFPQEVAPVHRQM